MVVYIMSHTDVNSRTYDKPPPVSHFFRPTFLVYTSHRSSRVGTVGLGRVGEVYVVTPVRPFECLTFSQQ